MNFVKFAASGIHRPKVQFVLQYLKHVQSNSLLLAYSILLRPLTLDFNLNWNSAPMHFTAKYTKLSNVVSKIACIPVIA